VEFLIDQTLALCEPESCDCNRSGGHLAPLDGDDAMAGRRDRAIGIAATGSGLQCQGKERKSIPVETVTITLREP
jgi:hypothetical protein